MSRFGKELAKKFANLHNTLAESLGRNMPNATLYCRRCRRESAPTQAELASFLRHGWPTCCGLTMQYETAKLKAEGSHES